MFRLCLTDLCRQCIPRIGEIIAPLDIDGGWLPAGRFWHGTGPEWDVVSSTLSGKNLLLGEAKWHQGAVTTKNIVETAAQLQRKGTPPVSLKTEYKTHYILFVPKKPTQKPVLPQGCHVMFEVKHQTSEIRHNPFQSSPQSSLVYKSERSLSIEPPISA